MNNEEVFYFNKGPLNLAHKHGRQAERKLLQQKFDEAVVEHEKAKEYLLEALKLTNVTQAVASLTLQAEYHKKQKEFVLLKKTQHEIRKKVIEHQLMKARQEIMASSSEDNSNEIQKAIFRTMEEADSLLDLLIINKTDVPPPPSVPSPKPSGSKLPKTDQNVIEELHTINIQLKKLIKQLMNELSEKDKQIAGLKSRLKFYEGSNFSTPSDIWESQDSNLDPK
uniref:Nuclear receptor-binding factor 2 n=2 Tax=Cacopsylla melanoneura TaxID=428564 RepID=A0A8D8RT52_9HEMI